MQAILNFCTICSNIDVTQCMFSALQNTYNIIVYKLDFYRCNFNVNLFDRDLKYIYNVIQTG